MFAGLLLVVVSVNLGIKPEISKPTAKVQDIFNIAKQTTKNRNIHSKSMLFSFIFIFLIGLKRKC